MFERKSALGHFKKTVQLESLMLQSVRWPLLISTALVALFVVSYFCVSEIFRLRSELHERLGLLRFNSEMALESSDEIYLGRLVASMSQGDKQVAVGVRNKLGKWVQVTRSSIGAPWLTPAWRDAFWGTESSTGGEQIYYSFTAIGIHSSVKNLKSESIGEVYIAISTRKLWASILKILVLIGLSFLISTALSVTFASWKAKSAAKGVEAFVDVVRKISNGKDSRARVSPLVLDSNQLVIEEVEKLALEFDSMLDQLELKGANLEIMVQERTLELEKSREKVSESARMAALGEMAGGIAHEINNPLAVIKASAENLMRIGNSESEISRESIKKLSERINRVSDRIAKIVSGLRAFAREGKGDPFERMDLTKVVNESLDFCLTRFRDDGIVIDVQKFPGELFVNGRPVQISQVLLNLLNNSHDALRAGEAEDSKIEISFATNGAWVEIHVADNGPGIPSLVRDKVMQPFFTTKEVGKGTGLGLSISSSIMEDHKGALVLDSPAKPTRFVMRFPHPDSATAPLLDQLSRKVA